MVNPIRLFRAPLYMVIVLVVLVGGDLLAQDEAKAASKQEIDSLLLQCREASLASDARLKTGKGKASFSREFGGKVGVKGTMDVAFTKSSYRLDIKYDVNNYRLNTKQLCVIKNKESVLICEVDVNGLRNRRALLDRVRVDSGLPSWVGIEANPHLMMRMVSVKDLNPSAITSASRLANDDVEVKFAVGKVLCRFVASASSGFNVTKSEAHQSSYANPALQQELISWARIDDIWYIRSVESILQIASHPNKERTTSRSKFTYDSFSPNVPVSEDIFSLSSTNLSDHSAIFDVRPNGNRAIHVYNKENASQPGADLAEQVEALPNLDSNRSNYHSNSRIVLYFAASIALLIATTVYLLLKWRRRSAQGM